MKAQQSRNRKIRTAGPILIALLLTIALLPGAALAAPPPLNGDTPPPNGDTPPPNGNTPGPNGNTPPPNGNTPPPQQNTPPPQQNTPPPAVNAGPPDADTPSPHPDAPNFPSADCIVTHAATPAQLCPIAGGLQYYFIGADGSSQTGPYIKPFSELATLHTVGTSVRLYTGSNPFTGKSVTIDYLVSDDKLRISTYYADTMYDTDKPYTFTVDSGNSVSHEAW